MDDLIIRLEEEGGSRELFEAVCAVALGEDEAIRWLFEAGYTGIPKSTWDSFAIALCDRAGWEIVMIHRPLKEWGILLQGGEDDEPFMLEDWQSSQQLPNALCIALLRALEDGK